MTKSILKVALIGLALLTLPAQAQENSDLMAKTQRLAELLNDPRLMLSLEQRQAISSLLDQATAIPEDPRGSLSESCFAEAYRFLPREQAKILCAGGGIDAARCYGEAHRTLSPDDALHLCRGGGTLRTAMCFSLAYRRLDSEHAIALCADRGTEETAACFEAAYRHLSSDDAIALCKHGGAMSRIACFETAYKNTSGEAAARQCRAH